MFAKKLVEEGKAYPCFTTEEEYEELQATDKKAEIKSKEWTAADNAADIPASPPPATNTSHFKTAERISFSPAIAPALSAGCNAASLSEFSSVGSCRARTCGALIIAEYPTSDIADAVRKPRRPIRFFPFLSIGKISNRFEISIRQGGGTREKFLKIFLIPEI